MGDSSSALNKTKIIHIIIACAKVMTIILSFFCDENQEQPFLFSIGDLGMLTLSEQKVKIDKRELI